MVAYSVLFGVQIAMGSLQKAWNPLLKEGGRG